MSETYSSALIRHEIAHVIGHLIVDRCDVIIEPHPEGGLMTHRTWKGDEQPNALSLLIPIIAGPMWQSEGVDHEDDDIMISNFDKETIARAKAWVNERVIPLVDTMLLKDDQSRTKRWLEEGLAVKVSLTEDFFRVEPVLPSTTESH